ncbi:transposase [uncultured Tateyamaria sp.]|uniref:transposase n=1 Tax=uncultured Tateyamaria sp. TaxID=455651 RepID=UPI002626810B|nr:transposase [uncultured Tateyamaria sp.]
MFSTTALVADGRAKYRYRVLQGDIWLRIRDICRQVCREKDVDIICGVLSSDHIHMVALVSPRLAISDRPRLKKERSSHKFQRESPQLRGLKLDSA